MISLNEFEQLSNLIRFGLAFDTLKIQLLGDIRVNKNVVTAVDPHQSETKCCRACCYLRKSDIF